MAINYLFVAKKYEGYNVTCNHALCVCTLQKRNTTFCLRSFLLQNLELSEILPIFAP